MKLHLPFILRYSLLSCLYVIPVASFIFSSTVEASTYDFNNENVNLSGEYTRTVDSTGSYLVNNVSSDFLSWFRLYNSSTLENNGRIDVKEDGYLKFSDSSTLNNNGNIHFSTSSGPICVFFSSAFTNSVNASMYFNSSVGMQVERTGNRIFTNYGYINFNVEHWAFSMRSATFTNEGTIEINSNDVGIYSRNSKFINGRDGELTMTVKSVGIEGGMVNHGVMDIKTGSLSGAYGIVVNNRCVNYGTLKTDSIQVSGSEMLFMNDSTVGAHTEGKALWVGDDSYYYKNILILGGVLNESENTVYGVDGGSRVTVSSDMEITGVQLKLFDYTTLAMNGNLTVGSDVSTQWNKRLLTIDNGGEAHTVTWGDTFSASWDKGLALVGDGSLTTGMGATWAAGKKEAMAQNLTLHSGNLTLYTKDSSYFKVPNITLESGTLNLRADDDSAESVMANSTITWAPTTASTPLLKLDSASTAQGIKIDANSTSLDLSRLSAQGQRVLDLENAQKFQFGVGETFSSLYDTSSDKYQYVGYQALVDKSIYSYSAYDFLRGSTLSPREDAIIYHHDLYYSTVQLHRQSQLKNNREKTWRGGEFAIYDAEKTYQPTPDKDGELNQSDLLYCQLATALNMSEYWLDRYAVLNTANKNLPFAKNPGSAALNNSGVYDEYSRAWWLYADDMLGSNAKVIYAIDWILTGRTEGLASQSMSRFYEGAAPFADSFLQHEELSLSELASSDVHDGKIYNVIASRGSADSLKDALTKAFNATDAPLALSFAHQKTGEKGDSVGHVVTCWGYETATIQLGNSTKEIISNLWCTDSDDNNRNTGAIYSMSVIYADDGRVYLVDSNVSRNLSKTWVLTGIQFFTTPTGMDDMLDDYYDESKPIYWTGTNTEWKKDNIGGRESQTRLATLSDGWRKECEGGGRSIWAYTTFSGSKEDVVFGESVNGVSVKERNIAVHDTVDAGTVHINGKGYVWNADGDWAKVSAKSLLVNSGSLTIGETLGVAVTDNVVVKSGASLKNDGLIEGNVYLEAGSEFHTGLIYVSQGEDPSALNVELGNGLYGHVVNRGLADGSGVVFVNSSTATSPYTLGTTVNFGNATITREMYKAVENGTLAGLVELAQLGIFGEGGSNEYVCFEFEPTHYKLQGRVDAFLDMFKIRKGEVSIFAGDAPAQDSLTIGSYGGYYGTSAANLQLSAVEGGTLRAEVGLETLAGERTLVNAESSVEAQTLRVVAGSELENDGELRGRVEVEGTLSGSGSFGAVSVHEGGSIVIGNSPGAAEYESLTLKNGSEIVFSVDGLTPAAEDLSGWGSGAHSVLTLTGTDALTLEDGAEVKIGFSSDFLTSVEIGKPQTLTLIQGVAANDELLAALQQATSFYYAGLDDSLSSLAENTLYSVHEFSWQAGADNSIALNVTLYYAGQGVVPEPTTTTLSLLALSMLAARRRRR